VFYGVGAQPDGSVGRYGRVPYAGRGGGTRCGGSDAESGDRRGACAYGERRVKAVRRAADLCTGAGARAGEERGHR
jgi:hypothetical protein